MAWKIEYKPAGADNHTFVTPNGSLPHITPPLSTLSHTLHFCWSYFLILVNVINTKQVWATYNVGPTWWGRRKPEEFSKMFKNGQNDKKQIHFSLKEIHLCIFAVGWKKVTYGRTECCFLRSDCKSVVICPSRVILSMMNVIALVIALAHITSFFVIYYHMVWQYSILYYIQSILVRYCCKILL